MLTISISFATFIAKIIGSLFLILIMGFLTYGSLASWNDPDVSGHGWINFILSIISDILVLIIVAGLIWEIPFPQLIEVVP